MLGHAATQKLFKALEDDLLEGNHSALASKQSLCF